MKILIVGLGAIGSHVALALRNIDAELTLCDFDVIEHKNTQAQFHLAKDVRKKKATSLRGSLYGLFGVKCYTDPVKVTDENVLYVVDGMDLVLDCTDNIAARQTLMSGCGGLKIELLHGAMSADGTFAQVTWTEQFTPDAETGSGVTCEDGENLPFHMMVGSCMAIAVQQFINDAKRDSYFITPTGITRR